MTIVSTIRRLYIYLLAFAGLAMFAFASANLGQLLIDVLLRSHDGLDREYLRSTISRWGAAALVGMPVWLVHWQWFAQRSASNPVERMSTLRRVHIYATLAGAMMFIGTSAHDLIYRLLELVNRSESLADTLRPLPFLAVATAVWLTISGSPVSTDSAWANPTDRPRYVAGTSTARPWPAWWSRSALRRG